MQMISRIIKPFILIQCALVLALPCVARGEILEKLILTALAAHPSIQAQQAQERGARADVDSARWQYFPTPSVSVEKARASASDPSYPGSSTMSTVRLQQPLWSGGRLQAGMKKAEASVIQSEAVLEDTRWQLALRVLQTYGDWLASHLKALAYDKSMISHMRLHDLVQRRIGQGLSSDSDLVLAVSRETALSADIAVTRAQKEIALARLGQLLGRSVDDAELTQTLAMARPLEPNLNSLLDKALALSPNVQKAQAQALIDESVVAQRRAELKPEVYLRLERQYGNYAFPNAAPENRVFIGVSSSFGAGLSNLSNIESANAQHEADLAQVEVQNRAVSEQVLADYALASSSAGRLDALGVSLDAAQQVSSSYDRQFLAGRKSWLDVMNAARELAQTEVQLADVVSAQVIVSWRLAIYTRGLASVVGENN